MIKVGNKYINPSQVMWIEDDGVNLKVYFEKSTILLFSKASNPDFLPLLERLALKSEVDSKT